MKILLKALLLLSATCSMAFAQLELDSFFASDSATVGGDLVFYIYDQLKGRGDTSEDTDASAGLKQATIYIRKELTDRLTVQIDPEIRVEAGATPKIGDEITRVEEGETEIHFLNAFISYHFDSDYTLKVGLFKPSFNWEYSHELFWNEHFHATQLGANPWLGNWNDFGIELYKAYEFDSFSLPVSLYLLNGAGHDYVDNNDDRTILLNVSPELMGGALKFNASYAFGKYDGDSKNDYTRYNLGVNVNIKSFTFRAEYMGGEWEDTFFVFQTKTGDIKPKGYYAKAIYYWTEKFNTVLGYSKAEHDFTGFFFTATDMDETYENLVFSANFTIGKAMTVMCSFDRTKADNDADGSLEYDRLSIGSRVTF